MKFILYSITIFILIISCSKKIDDKMVLIPGGEFFMGSDSLVLEIPNKYPSSCSEDWFDGEFPLHKVYIDSFYLDRYEVTFAQFTSFVDETGYKSEGIWDSLYNSDHNLDIDNIPVVGVSWNDAKAYCNWLDKRLPTEAEWEYAAKGPDKNLVYPWGNEVVLDMDNVQNEEGIKTIANYPPNKYGIYDLGGNVQEWCNDFYDKEYYINSPFYNPKGPEEGTEKVVRGGSFYMNAVFYSRTAHRSSFNNSWFTDSTKNAYFKNFGFRCAKSIK